MKPAPSALPDPAQLFARLAGATAGGACAAALGVALLVPLALGGDHAGGARALALALGVGGVLLAALLAHDTTRRARALHGYLLRLAASGSVAPPSEAAVRDALSAPTRLARSFAVGAAGLLLADALGVAHLSGTPDGLSRALLDLAAWLVVMVGSWLVRGGAEWALGPWLSGLDPGELALSAPASLARTLARAAAWPPAAATLLAATGAAAQTRSLTPLLVGAAMALGVAALAYWLARRPAAATAAEVRALAAYAGGVGPEPREAMSAPPRGTPSAELHSALVGLGERLVAARESEERARRAIAEAQQLETQFLASMSHDLRSPLNSVRGFSDLLLGGLDGPLLEPQRESVVAIRRAGEDLLRLLTDVLDSARLETGRLELRRAWTPSVEILTEAVRRGRLIAVERARTTGQALSIEAELQPGLPPVYVDSERIVQAVVGLFGHAARAMEGGTIRLRAHVARGEPGAPTQVRVDVTDTGRGIPESERERIFEAFRGVRDGRRVAGLGLGLALARALVRAHGGEVSVTSAADGTTFTVALPTDGPPDDFEFPSEPPR